MNILRSVAFVASTGLALFLVEVWSVKEANRAYLETLVATSQPTVRGAEYFESILRPELFVGVLLVIIVSYLYFRNTATPSLKKGFLFGLGVVAAWILIKTLLAAYFSISSISFLTTSEEPLLWSFFKNATEAFEYDDYPVLLYIPAVLIILTATLSGWVLEAKHGVTRTLWLVGLAVGLIVLSVVVT